MLTNQALEDFYLPLLVGALQNCEQDENEEHHVHCLTLVKSDSDNKLEDMDREQDQNRTESISCHLALFLLSHIFFVVTHSPLINKLSIALLRGPSCKSVSMRDSSFSFSVSSCRCCCLFAYFYEE